VTTSTGHSPGGRRLPTWLACSKAWPACSTAKSARCGPTICTPIGSPLALKDVPVSDVDRAKAFYVDQVGFNADYDQQVNDKLRFVQLTPPGSACSIAIGTGLIDMVPGTLRNLQIVVADVRAARAQLVERGVDASDVDVQPWGSFVTFADPDGNTWALQQLPAR
jgi:predicted enzyme related to lactoylglutathione lyase